MPTGIKAVFTPEEMDTWHLQMYVRSSVGNKGLMLASNVAVIDSDYYLSENDGDIMMPLMNVTDNLFKAKAGDRICQGIFVIHGIVNNDNAVGIRTGGMGSTGL